MHNLKVLIVDDEVLIAEDLKDTLKSFGISNIKLAHSKEEATKILESDPPNLVLLDIRMKNDLEGLEIAELINLKFKIPFIYITAHSDLATVKEIVKTGPDGYITKPVKKSDLFASINLLVENNYKESSCLHIKDGYEVKVIAYKNILYIEGEGNYINIYTVGTKVALRRSLDSIFSELDPLQFFRIHRSFIVNLNKITRYSKKEIRVADVSLPVSRNYGPDLEMRMKEIQQAL